MAMWFASMRNYKQKQSDKHTYLLQYSASTDLSQYSASLSGAT